VKFFLRKLADGFRRVICSQQSQQSASHRFDTRTMSLDHQAVCQGRVAGGGVAIPAGDFYRAQATRAGRLKPIVMAHCWNFDANFSQRV
jgi:hypothetical protein